MSCEAEGILLDYSKSLMDAEVLSHLVQLAEDSGLKQAMQDFRNGATINETENRKVLHTALRCPENALDSEEAKWAFGVRKEMKKWVEAIHQGDYTSVSGKKFTHVVNIGIGGSYLGPRFLHDALRLRESKMDLHFISNVDPQNLDDVLQRVPLDTTLFILVSKSFGTIETLSNAAVIKDILLKEDWGQEAVGKHFIGISSNVEKAVAWGLREENILPLPDWAGGRFSVWGSVGLGLALAYGMDAFEGILNGAHQMDQHFFHAAYKENLPIVLALIGIWNVNFLDINNKTLVPYDSLLRLLPSYLQQMVMESNGKSANRDGEPINYQTSPIYWGEIGTDAQHSFFQQLHQGTVATAMEFMLPKTTQSAQKDLERVLQYNCLAQASSLAFGKDDNESDAQDPLNAYRQFPGNVPSTMLVYDALTPEMLGKLIALYEHQTFVQGIVWNIFSFDQWGVELGKKVAQSLENVDEAALDSSTRNLLKRLGL
ncbi:unnamed protein product [Cyprideis torosa]|uniref:Glucose-6-phosphate isomerase n=1 Tax=Cyprideis torosa TaxID=163714 RepID=A0A7R8ZRA2_9CRUS|nr:unnamed protein product [Cyprideis torosa]CAG0892526.1 unnamed protein product [Cyprideis torosa]